MLNECSMSTLVVKVSGRISKGYRRLAFQIASTHKATSLPCSVNWVTQNSEGALTRSQGPSAFPNSCHRISSKDRTKKILKVCWRQKGHPAGKPYTSNHDIFLFKFCVPLCPIIYMCSTCNCSTGQGERPAGKLDTIVNFRI